MAISLRRLLLCALFFFLISAQCFAQSPFLDGHLVTNRNDTLKGFVRYENWETSPTEIFFKRTPEATSERYAAGQIQSFFVTSKSEVYVSQRATIRLVSNTVYRAEPNERVEVQAFMQKILAGQVVSLYRLVAELDGRERFFVQKEGQLTELINYSYQIERNDQVFEKTVDQYKSQLGMICSGATNFNAPLPGYEEKALRTYLRKYNACFGDESIVYEAPALKPELAWALNGGVQIFRAESFGFTTRVAPTFGGTFRVSLPRLNHNRFFRVNLDLSPGVKYLEVENFKEVEKTGLFKSIEAGVGSYFGSQKIRPYAYASFAYQSIAGGGSAVIYLNGGLSLHRRADLEFSHFIAPVNFKLALPRIAFHYYFDVAAKK